MGNPFRENKKPFYDGYIQDAKALIEEADREIREFQSGESKPVRFSKGFINNALLGGLYTGNIITIGGISGGGKSHLLQTLEDDYFNKDLNPDCDDYILLRVNLEMAVRKLYLRELKKGLNKNIADILKEEFSSEEEDKALKVRERESNPRIKYFQQAQDPETWFKVVTSFCAEHIDKKFILITLDHAALMKGDNKKGTIDRTIEYANQIRQMFPNVSFIILSQLNRDIESRVDNPKNAVPRRSDLYASDTIFHISDIVIISHIPYKLGLQEYMAIHQSQYTEFSCFKKDPSKKTSTFTTKGLVFYHILKLREMEDGTISDLFIEEMYPTKRVVVEEPLPELPRMEPSAELFDDEVSPYD